MQMSRLALENFFWDMFSIWVHLHEFYAVRMRVERSCREVNHRGVELLTQRILESFECVDTSASREDSAEEASHVLGDYCVLRGEVM